MMLERVVQTIKKFNLIELGEKIVVAVSGGPDSVALLYALYQLKNKLSITLHVAHLDHSFRGKQSKEDGFFVAEFCQRLDLPCSFEKIDVPALVAQQKKSPQDVARKIRYDFLENLSDRIGAHKIATGHNANDQGETMLLWLARGTGLDGLTGIPPKNGRYIRPLIEVERADIEKFLSDNQLLFRIDSSNSKTDYRRNFIRHKILPQLNEVNSNTINNFCKTADILRNIDDYLQEVVKDIEPKITKKWSKDKISLDLTALFDYHVALKNRILRTAIRKIKGDLNNIQYNHLEALNKLIEKKKSGSQLHLPDGIMAYIEYSNLFIVKCKNSTIIKFSGMEILCPGITEIPQLGIKIIAREYLIIEKINYKRSFSNEAFFNFDSIQLPLILRFREDGDTFLPFGMQHHKKLQDFFVDEKVPLSKRDKVPIIQDKKQILWIVGHRTSEASRIFPDTQKIIHLKIENIKD